MLASSRTLVLILLAACLGAGGLATPAEASAPVPDDTALHTWRAARRAEVRARSLAGAAKTLADPEAASARFGLLVIPVDFADHRLPAGWDPAGLAPRLTAVDGQSLRHYFTVASGGRCEVVPVLAPLVRLPGIARDYSDIGLNGFTRSRRLAALAIEAVAAAGFDLRAADLDGPDGRAGTADDDGWVDGVLILHADPGQENDAANGLIQALQYYLDPPFAAEGITAGPYATASLASGPGIWAHETAHLLGMEDRYDPLLPPDPGGGSGAGDLAGAGGLGVFSLMAAGALGTGGGWGPSLPDAYSRALLGWCDVVTIASSPAEGDTLRAAPDGTVTHRVWTRGEPGSEFFLLEARDPGVAVPFDAALPAAGLVALHVDETVPEGSWRDDGFGQWHLRARLVEADGGRELRDGLDAGAAGDVFPGPGSVTSLAPDTTPSSDGYEGPTGVAVSGIGYANGLAVHHTLGDAQPWLDFDVAFGEGPVHEMLLTARVHGGAATSLSLRVEAVGEPVWGDFGDGSRSVEVPLIAHGDGAWRPASTVRWTTPGGQPTDAFTRFRYTLSGPGVTTLRRHAAVDLDEHRPGARFRRGVAGFVDHRAARRARHRLGAVDRRGFAGPRPGPGPRLHRSRGRPHRLAERRLHERGPRPPDQRAVGRRHDRRPPAALGRRGVAADRGADGRRRGQLDRPGRRRDTRRAAARLARARGPDLRQRPARSRFVRGLARRTDPGRRADLAHGHHPGPGRRHRPLAPAAGVRRQCPVAGARLGGRALRGAQRAPGRLRRGLPLVGKPVLGLDLGRRGGPAAVRHPGPRQARQHLDDAADRRAGPRGPGDDHGAVAGPARPASRGARHGTDVVGSPRAGTVDRVR
ncbi:MAG: hypothetical protein IPJ24_09630 [bacterium]|nr:hypothetical protein [bacterium]